MSVVSIESLRVRYAGRKQPALESISLSVGRGEVVGVFGRTGAGKSTLCLAAAGFIPRVVRASTEGTLRIGDIDAMQAALGDLAGRVGIVFSSPALQLSASKPTVREELAFGLENLGVPRQEMDGRIDFALGRLGIGHLAERDPLALSGGEQQRVAIASIVVMGTELLVLDEPAAQLDPQGTSAIATLVRQLAGEGHAVLVAEHAPEVLAASQRCVVLDGGRLMAEDEPSRALRSDVLEPLGLEAPTLLAVADAAGVSPASAFDEEVIASALAGQGGRLPARRSPDTPALPELSFIREASPATIEVGDLVHRYPGGVEAVRGVSMTVAPGEVVAIVGQNGSGKTTLAKHLNGLLRPAMGRVELGGHDIGLTPVSELAAQVGFVFQNPDDQLFNSRVDQEIGFGPRNLRFEAKQVDAVVDKSLELVGLTDERSTNPYDLGFSHRKLVALASVLAMEPPILVLDEPTTGQDGPGVRRIGAIVDAWAAAGRTVIAITHDMEFAARHFRRIVVMRAGEIILDGPPSEVFAADNWDLLASTGLTAPPAARIAARLGLTVVPSDAAALLGHLASTA